MSARALLITRNLPPLQGGMERLVQRIAGVLAADRRLAVVGPAGCTPALPAGADVVEVPLRPLHRFLWRSLRASGELARADGLDLVLAGSGLTAPHAWWTARRRGATSVVYLHGLDILAPSLVYRLFWLPFVRRIRTVLVNSANTRRLAIAHGVPAAAIHVLHPGTELPAPAPAARAAFRARHGLGDGPLLLSVGRFTPRKGLAEFVERAFPAIRARHPQATLLVIGGDPVDAVRAPKASGRARILAAAAAAGLADAVRILPPCDDAELASAYRAADVHVFPVLELPGDVEGFGMVAIEAAAHGLPTVGFAVGGVPDAIVPGSGTLVDPGDYPRFATSVGDWLARIGDPAVADDCRRAAAAFGWERFGERLRALLPAPAGRAA